MARHPVPRSPTSIPPNVVLATRHRQRKSDILIAGTFAQSPTAMFQSVTGKQARIQVTPLMSHQFCGVLSSPTQPSSTQAICCSLFDQIVNEPSGKVDPFFPPGPSLARFHPPWSLSLQSRKDAPFLAGWGIEVADSETASTLSRRVREPNGTGLGDASD